MNKELCIKVGKWNNSILWCTVKKTLYIYIYILICVLFKDTINISEFTVSNGRKKVNNDSPRMWKEAVAFWLILYVDICLAGMRRTVRLSRGVKPIFRSDMHTLEALLLQPASWFKRRSVCNHKTKETYLPCRWNTAGKNWGKCFHRCM